jgi:hypothetical protein
MHLLSAYRMGAGETVIIPLPSVNRSEENFGPGAKEFK